MGRQSGRKWGASPGARGVSEAPPRATKPPASASTLFFRSRRPAVPPHRRLVAPLGSIQIPCCPSPPTAKSKTHSGCAQAQDAGHLQDKARDVPCATWPPPSPLPPPGGPVSDSGTAAQRYSASQRHSASCAAAEHRTGGGAAHRALNKTAFKKTQDGRGAPVGVLRAPATPSRRRDHGAARDLRQPCEHAAPGDTRGQRPWGGRARGGRGGRRRGEAGAFFCVVRGE